jgi:antitoxin (DNA-binding transcriptional repressor) of toxin-antitoxin stability system
MARSAAASRGSSRRRARRVTATELARSLSDVLNRVHYQRETVIVVRGGKPVCQLAPVPASLEFQLSDLVVLLGSLDAPGGGWAEAVAEGVAEQGDFEGRAWPR